MKLSKSDIKEWHLAEEQAYMHKTKIIERIDYILRYMFGLYGVVMKTWYFADAKEGDFGTLRVELGSDNIYDIFVELAPNKIKPVINFIISGKEWKFDTSILTRWLFEDFETEMFQGAADYIQLQEKKKNALKPKPGLADTKTQLLAKSAKAKLTKAELAALKKTL